MQSQQGRKLLVINAEYKVGMPFELIASIQGKDYEYSIQMITGEIISITKSDTNINNILLEWENYLQDETKSR